MSTAKSVAKELVRLSTVGSIPDLLTHYRLQCLLYYAQGWSLVLRDSELFPEDIKALEDGPKVPDLIAHQDNGASWLIIEAKTFEPEPDLDQEDETSFLQHLWSAYAYLSNSGLYNAV